MCWNMTIKWTRRDGQTDSVPRFLEMLCAFCSSSPDDSRPDFPERVARQHRDHPNEITELDVAALRRLMVARNLTPDVVQELQESPAIRETVSRIDCAWHLFYMPDDSWEQIEVAGKIADALEATMNVHGVGLAVGTKLLHLKRPHLIPMCDSFTVRRLLDEVPGQPQAAAMRCIARFREIGIANLDTIARATAHLQQRIPVSDAYYGASLVRALEAVIWFDEGSPARRIYAALWDRP